MRGTGLSGVALLADSDAELRHFMVSRLLRRAGQSQDRFLFGVSSEPGLREALEREHIKVVVPLGERALMETLGQRDIERWRGRVAETPLLPGMFVLPTFQPSKLLNRKNWEGDEDDVLRHPPRFHGVWMRDLHRALDVAANGFVRQPVHYLLDPSVQAFEDWCNSYFAFLRDHPEAYLSWDIETPWKKGKDESELEAEEINVLDGVILRVSYAFIPGQAVSVPWAPSYLPGICRLLNSRGRMVVWNGSVFDVPVVTGTGVAVSGEIFDFMDGYHLLESDLPKGLEWVSAEATDILPWKHLASAEPAWYSCTDADAALRNALYIETKLKQRNQWHLMKRHVVQLMPHLARAGAWGNKVNRQKRDEIREKLTLMKNELVAEVQQYVPRWLLPKTEFKRQPDSVVGDFAPVVGGLCPSPQRDLPGWDIVWVSEDIKVCNVCDQHAPNKTEHYKGKKNPCKKGAIEKRPGFVARFDRLELFNPNSSDQLKAYMRDVGHPLGQNKKDSSKETADAGHLKSLMKKFGKEFPLYGLSLEVHKATKTIGTYTPEPDENDCIHTIYVNSTSTWRLGSKKCKFGTQIQNWGKRGSDDPDDHEGNKYAKEARKQIIARPGHKLVQVDSSAIEAVLQGYFMNDPQYMRTASQSIHAWLACRALGWEFNPDNVDKVKKEHAGLYMRMKTTNYLTNFGGGDYLLWQSFPEQFPTRAAAKYAQDSLYALLPSLKAYHHAVRWEAHTKSYLESPWGYRHYYYDVFKPSWDTTKIDYGKDSKRTVAFKPQNSNASFQRDNLLLVGESKFGQYMPTNVSVHDSCCLDVPAPLVDEATLFLSSVFTRPIEEMRGLRIGCEVEVGDNWGEMERVHKVVVDDYTMAFTEAGELAA